MRFVFRTILFVFLSVIFISKPLTTDAGITTDTIKNVGAFYKGATSSLLNETVEKVAEVGDFYMPLAVATANSLDYIFDTAYSISDQALNSVIGLGRGVLDVGQYQIVHTGESIGETVVSAAHFTKTIPESVSARTQGMIEDTSITVNKLVKGVAENIRTTQPRLDTEATKKDTIASAKSAVRPLSPSFKDISNKVVVTSKNAGDSILDSFSKIVEVADRNINDATVALGDAGYAGVENLVVGGNLIGNSVLYGVERAISVVGESLAESVIKTGDIAAQSARAVHGSLSQTKNTSIAGVGSVWNFVIDKISTPLVPLFVPQVTETFPIKEASVKKDLSGSDALIQKNTPTKQSNVAPVNSVIERIVEKPSYFTIDNSVAINNLRKELIALNSNTVDYLRDRIANQGYYGGQGISNTITNVISSGSKDINANTLTVGTLDGVLIGSNGSVGATSNVSVSLGGTGTTTAPSYGQLLLGNANGTYDLVSTSTLGISGVIGSGSGSVTSVALSVPTGLTVSGGPITTSGTFTLGIESGYTIPLSASTTEWDTAYTNRITSASSPLSISNHVISLSTAGDWAGTLDSHEGAYYLDANNLTNFGVPFYTYFSATTTDALSEGVTNKYFTDARVAGVIAGTTTSALAEGSNLYYTPARVASVIAGTTTDALAQGSTNKYYSSALFNTDFSSKTTDTLTEGTTNKYFSNTLARGALSSGATGLTYNNSTGIFSLTSGYSIPLSASTTEWNSAYSNRITSASTPLSISGNTISIDLAGTSQDGYLSSTDWNTFNNKVSSQWTTSGSNIYYTTGSAGVGTTSPSAKFAVTGSGATTGRALVVANSSNADRFVVNDSGDVSLGLNLTSTQSGTFNIVSQTGNIAIQPGGGGATYFYQQGIRLSDGTQGFNRPAANELGILSSGSERIRVASGGNIGIGSTTPWKKLSVAGDISLTGALYDSTASAGTSGYVLQSTGTGIQWVATSTLGFTGGGGGTVTSIDVSGGVTGLSFSGGPITTSGTMTLGGVLAIANGGTGTTTAPTYGKILVGNAGGTYDLVATSSLGISGGGGSSQWTTSGSDIYYTTGNVGVGTTTPGAKFAVTGNSLFGGNITTTGLLSILGTGTSTIASNISISGDIVPTTDITYSLGAPDKQWKDVFIGPGSLYINGQKVLQEESQSIVVTADINQNLVFRTSGTGDLELNPSGSGLIQLKGNVQLSGGYDFSTSNNSTVSFSDGIKPGNISIVGNTITATNSNGSLALSADGSGAIYTTTGNLGVGSTTPWKKLSVAGDISLTGALYDSTASAGTSGYVLQSTGTGIQWVATSSLNISGGSPSQWTTSGSDIYYSTGKVGIGTSTPTNPLVVSGYAHATLGLTVGGTSATTTGTRLSLTGGSLSSYSSSESTARWTIGNSAITNGVGGLVFDSTIGGQSATGGAIGQSVARTLSFYTSNGSTLTERATIDGSGNFGIGSTTPWGQLSINSNGITGPSFVVGSSTATKFIVTNGGNVGIGTASPTSALDVQGTYGSHLVVGKSGQAGIIYLRRGSDGAAAAYLGYIGASEGGALSLTSGGGAGSITLNASGGSVSVVAANTAHSVFHSNGNLGVGSTTPWKKLSVAGDISLTGALYDSTASAGTSGYVLQSTGTGIQWVATSTLGFTGGGGGSSQWTTSGSDIYYSTGSVGVGTSTPWAQFSINPNGITGPAFVVGSSTATKFVVSNAGKVGIGLTSPSTLLHISGANSANEVEYLRFSSSNTAAQGDELSTYWYAGNSNTKLAKLSVYNEGSSKAGFRFGVTSDGGSTVPNKMVLTGDGYLGVGTANTPAATLNLSKTNSIAGSEWELMRYTLTANSFTGDEISSYWYTQGTSHKLAKMSVINEGGGKAGFRFGTTNDGAVTTPNRVAITGDGRLGVGLVNPQTTLEVQGTASTSALYIPTTQSATIGTLNLGGNRFLHGYTTASTFVGPNSGNFTTTGTYNTGLGSSALSTVTSGHTNVAVGASALAGVTTGARNVGIGYLAIGSGSGGGTDNIAIGYGAISASSLSGNYNTVLGSWAGRALTSASNSVMVGYGAGYSNSTGASNVFVGYNSGYNTTGGSNIMIGYQAGNNLVAGTNNIIIGYDIDATSTTMTKGLNIGNLLFGTGLDGSATTLSTGNIGIGTTTPWAKFSVDSSSLGTSPAFVVGSSTATSMIITNGGLMGVGTASPAFPIDVAVTVDSNQTYGYLNPAGAIGTSAGTNSYSIRATGRIIASEFNAVSDARLKDVQFNLDSKMALDAITKLQPVSFTWKDNPNGQPVLGLLAQEVELAIPNAVSKLQTDKFSDQREVSYNQIVAVMIGAIKEIKSQINDISSKISYISSWFVDDKLRIQNDICVDDVCVSKQEFKQLLLNNGASHTTVQAPNPNTTSDNGSDTSTATTTNNSISSETASTTQTSNTNTNTNTNTSTSTSTSDTSTVTEVTQTAPEPSRETETPASSPVIEQVPQPSVSESTENSGSQESVQ